MKRLNSLRIFFRQNFNDFHHKLMLIVFLNSFQKFKDILKAFESLRTFFFIDKNYKT